MTRAPAGPEPERSRPWMPGYGVDPGPDGLLPWDWARERLAGQRTYWICTAGVDGPHAAPVWGVWVDEALWFSTGSSSRKYRNLLADPRCIVAVDRGDESLTLEGVAALVGRTGGAQWADLVARPYAAKYGTDITGMDEPLFRLPPLKVIGQIDREGEFTRTATRWTFRRPRG